MWVTYGCCSGSSGRQDWMRTYLEGAGGSRKQCPCSIIRKIIEKNNKGIFENINVTTGEGISPLSDSSFATPDFSLLVLFRPPSIIYQYYYTCNLLCGLIAGSVSMVRKLLWPTYNNTSFCGQFQK